MNPTREQVFSALFARVCTATVGGIPPFITTSRRLKLWSDVPSALQPALFQVEHGETYAPRPKGLPIKITLEASLFVYVTSGDSTAIPAMTVNAILDAIDATLQPAGPQETGINRCTLGGLVDHCWIEGKVFKDPGDIDNQGLAVVPIRIVIPYGSGGP